MQPPAAPRRRVMVFATSPATALKCGHDFGDCGYCMQGCTQVLYTNSVCDNQCNGELCNNDNNNCVIPTQDLCNNDCTYSLLQNSVCDVPCNVSSCNFDYDYCDCSPGCTRSMLGNGVCNSQCMTEDCEYDFGDFWKCGPSSLYVVSPSYVGTTIATFTNIMEAILAVGPATTIYLLGSDFVIDGNVGGASHSDPLGAPPLAFAKITIEPYYCSQSNIAGCYAAGVRPILNMQGTWVQFNLQYTMVLNNLIITNLPVTGPTCQVCTGCSYCPYSVVVNGVTYGDKGTTLQPNSFLPTSCCNGYSNSILFYVYSTGVLELNVILM